MRLLTTALCSALLLGGLPPATIAGQDAPSPVDPDAPIDEPGAADPVPPSPDDPPQPGEDPAGEPVDAPLDGDALEDLDFGLDGDLTIVDTAVARLAEKTRADALRDFEAKNYPAALKGFQAAYELEPGDAEITNNLAYLHELLGNYEDAERFYREAIALDSERGVAHMNLADLLARDADNQERLAEAARLLKRARELSGNEPKLILRQGRVAAARGRFEEADRAFNAYVETGEMDDALRLEIGDFHRSFNRPEQALVWYRRVDGPGKNLREAAKRIFDLEVEREARRLGFGGDPRSVSKRALSLVDKGRLLTARGKLDEAEALLREAVTLAPGYAMARALLGDVLVQQGERTEAELSMLRALAIDNGRAEIHRRLAELYATAPDNDRAAEAAMFYDRTLSLRPDWHDLHVEAARANQAAGDLPRALFHVNRYLAQAGSGTHRDTARSLKRTLEELLGDGKSADAGPQQVAGRGPLSRARAHLARGDTRAALVVLRRMPRRDQNVEVLNLEARILYAAGRAEEAARTLRRSLRVDPSQTAGHEQLARIFIEDGRIAAGRGHLLDAERLGSLDGSLELARLDTGKDRGIVSFLYDPPKLFALLSAVERLDRVLQQSGEAERRADAGSLRKRTRARLRAMALAAAAVALLLLIGLWMLRQRIFGGIDLHTLLERAPEAGPEVQRILSSIRHEVLKHNTMMLTGLAEALGRGEAATEEADHAVRALFGDDAQDGAVHRLLAYAEQLRQVARAHEQRLNLERRDTAVGAIIEGFEQLDTLRGALGKVDRMSPRRRKRLGAHLQGAIELLNTRGYGSVRQLLDHIRLLDVDAALLRSVFETVRREPALAAADVVLDIDEDAALPCSVLIPRQSFEDILANLLRNALQATLRDRGDSGGNGAGRAHIGLGVRIEVDDITALQRVVFLVRDRAPETLSAEMLRGRYIEEGLGLTADLVSRYDGSLDVEPGDAGWTKAVAMGLPAAVRERLPEPG